jgi:dTDP-4-amino-4,6-dideoxygalactose transaminase
MPVPQCDLTAQYKSIKQEIDEAIHRVVDRGVFILGDEVRAFEEEIAAYLGVKNAMGVASGTDALQLALLACDIGPGDEVITTTFTFIASAEAITQCGAVPVFVDIDPDTYNMSTKDLESKINEKTKGILPVHLFGQSTEMDDILELAERNNLKIIEDCAQALGAKYKTRKVGSIGDVGCLSFFPSKMLGAFGDGGMVVTNDSNIADKVKMLRNHGAKQKYYHLLPGFNSRLDEVQAAVLRVKLRYLPSWIELRRQKAKLYTTLFDQIDGIQPPYTSPDNYHVFNYYVIRLSDGRFKRDDLRKYLNEKGIATAVYYPLSLHLQQIYKNLGYKRGDFPESEQAQEELLSLPIYPEIEDEQIQEVVKAVKTFDR